MRSFDSAPKNSRFHLASTDIYESARGLCSALQPVNRKTISAQTIAVRSLEPVVRFCDNVNICHNVNTASAIALVERLWQWQPRAIAVGACCKDARQESFERSREYLLNFRNQLTFLPSGDSSFSLRKGFFGRIAAPSLALFRGRHLKLP